MASLVQITPDRALTIGQEHEAVTPMAAYEAASCLTGMAARWPSTTENKGCQCQMLHLCSCLLPACPCPSHLDLGSPWDGPQEP